MDYQCGQVLNHFRLSFLLLGTLQPHYGINQIGYDREEEELNLALALSKSGE